ncbi:glycosyltransferase family 4 protein [Pseudocnuella soli]|uniref:glycosyltransferase family 4 protein n=1 Tax=Pseudocnuella soli TaxID=2502779 RepID=UPI001044F5DC|nr:glycosyltransferase family 4 protein [Pseudocnuella soli]
MTLVYGLITLKRLVEQVVITPFVWWGKLKARRRPLEMEYDVFFFFPTYGLGGAEKVNAEILDCVKDKKCIVFFTKKPCDEAMLHLFATNGIAYHDISRWTDNKKRYWENFIYRGICAAYINGQTKLPVVFNGQCNFAYKLFPHLNLHVRKVELIHTADRQFTLITLPYIPFIDLRVMITNVHIEEHRRYYRKFGVSKAYDGRMRRILNKVEMTNEGGLEKEYGPRLKFYYAGRGGAQKRVWLLVEAMRRCQKLNLPVDFFLAGNFEAELPADHSKFCTYLGQLKGGEAMNKLHQQMDVLMLTSAYEGFPMVIMEAMTFGVVPIATAVDGVPEHIRHMHNGLLIDNASEEKVVKQLIEHVQFLCGNRAELLKMSKHAFNYAKNEFSGNEFCSNYRYAIFNQ